VADDSVLVREGVARLLADAGFEVVAQVGDPDALLRAVRDERPEVAIVDIRMPPTHTDEGLRAAQAIRAEHGTSVGILVLSQHVEPSFALRLVNDGVGGVGYLLKDRVRDVDDLAEAIRRIANGGSVIDPDVVAVLVGRRARVPLDDLTAREREVLGLMAEGRSNQAIGDRLGMARKTVEAHIATIFSKLQLEPAADDHRRVLAVLAHLRGPG
jgi:DNA-binding NarL/FixJ family response regulator